MSKEKKDVSGILDLARQSSLSRRSLVAGIAALGRCCGIGLPRPAGLRCDHHDLDGLARL